MIRNPPKINRLTPERARHLCNRYAIAAIVVLAASGVSIVAVPGLVVIGSMAGVVGLFLYGQARAYGGWMTGWYARELRQVPIPEQLAWLTERVTAAGRLGVTSHELLREASADRASLFYGDIALGLLELEDQGVVALSQERWTIVKTSSTA